MASSTMRLSGLISGMDTESIIQQLVSAKQTKVDDAKKAQTKLEWKTTAWKDLNTKLKNLQSKYVNNMRFTSAYMKKTTSVSDSTAASVITGENAMNGVQNLKITQLAKTAYMTGGKTSLRTKTDADGDDFKLNALTKLSDLSVDNKGTALNLSTGTTLNIKSGDTNVELEITADTTISNVLTKLKEAGLNANFDETQQRFYISAKDSGEGNDFSITASDETGNNVLKSLGLDSASANKIDAQNAKITLNGTEYESNTNVFSINSLTITAMKETAENVVVTTKDDVDGIYDMIKSFLKDYNSIINEMDKLYNADSAKGYEPLTDDEKDALRAAGWRGRTGMPGATASRSFGFPTSSSRALRAAAAEAFRSCCDPHRMVHRLGVTATGIVDPEHDDIQLDLFHDPREAAEEDARLRAVNEIRRKFGSNAMLRGMDLLPKATARQRNEQIGGHRSGL